MSEERKPVRIPTQWGDFWTIGDRSTKLFLSQEDAARVVAMTLATPPLPLAGPVFEYTRKK